MRVLLSHDEVQRTNGSLGFHQTIEQPASDVKAIHFLFYFLGMLLPVASFVMVNGNAVLHHFNIGTRGNKQTKKK